MLSEGKIRNCSRVEETARHRDRRAQKLVEAGMPSLLGLYRGVYYDIETRLTNTRKMEWSTRRHQGISLVQRIERIPEEPYSLSVSTGAADTVDKPRNRSRSLVNHVSTQGCVNSAGSHGLAKCEGFLSLAVEQRCTLAGEKRVCINCLRSGHFTPKCPSKSRCVHCRRTHHSLSRGRQDR
jgi:hypothetical protein